MVTEAVGFRCCLAVRSCNTDARIKLDKDEEGITQRAKIVFEFDGEAWAACRAATVGRAARVRISALKDTGNFMIGLRKSKFSH
jgi:hypothetical protein